MLTDSSLRQAELQQFMADEQNLGRWYRGKSAVSCTSGSQGPPLLVMQEIVGPYVRVLQLSSARPDLVARLNEFQPHVIVGYASVLDDQYRPVPVGQLGSRVLITNLANRIQPFIRYEVVVT